MPKKTTPEYNIPDLHYTDPGPKKMISIRLPVPLIKEMDRLAGKKGCTTTDLIQAVLDQYAQWENGVKPKKRS